MGLYTMPDGKNYNFASDEEATEAMSAWNKQFPNTEKESSVIDDIGRQLGLTARAGISGISALPNMAGDALGLDSTKTVSRLMTKIGLPEPRNATERVAQDVAGAVAGGGGIMSLGRGMVSAISPIARSVGGMLSAQPMMQTASSITGSGATGIARESGAGPGGQLAAGVLSGLAPATISSGMPATVKSVFRGGEAGRQRMAENIQTFEGAGYGTPSLGQATESRFTRGVESILAKTPGSAGRMVKRAETSAENIGGSVARMADDLSAGATSTKAGSTIEKGIKVFVEKFKEKQGTLYDKLDQYIPPDTAVPATNIQAKLKQLGAPIFGAEDTSNLLKTPKIGSISSAIDRDVGAKPAYDILSSILDANGKPIITGQIAAQPGGMPYQALKELRSSIGAKISNPSLTDDIPTGQWKQLYAALSEDMGMAAKSAGPAAEGAFVRANAYTKAGHERIGTFLNRVAGKDTVEKVFTTATNPSEIREGASTINAVMRSLDPDARDVVRAAFIKRLGTATAGNQDAAGDVFSTNTFLTNWNNISPEAKMTLFAGKGGAVRANLDKVAKVASNIRDGSKVFANPSGTQQAITAQIAIGGAVMAVFTGNFGAAGIIAGAAGGANLSSRLMTSPDFVKWLAKTTALPTGALPAALNNLAQISKGMQGDDKAAVDQFIESAQAGK